VLSLAFKLQKEISTKVNELDKKEAVEFAKKVFKQALVNSSPNENFQLVFDQFLRQSDKIDISQMTAFVLKCFK
jgi:hypothetical protein